MQTDRPTRLCGFAVRRLAAADTVLATAPSGRPVVLKRVGDDCLLDRDLHPSIKLRLARVRELASTRVATLLGVWRDGDDAWLAWEELPGRPLAELIVDPAVVPVRLVALLRETASAVAAMHALGIVHGAVHPRNVFVHAAAAGDTVRLTHVSPLLFDDPAADEVALQRLLDAVAEARPELRPRMEEASAAMRRSNTPIEALLGALAASPARSLDVGIDEEEERGVRGRALAAAIAVAVAGAMVAIVAYSLAPR
jgi:tRNA A-37 threonylcarbamoyl transferase component Bud32